MSTRDDTATTIRCPGCGRSVFSWTFAGATPEGRVRLDVRHRASQCALELTWARAGEFRREVREAMSRFAAQLRGGAVPGEWR